VLFCIDVNFVSLQVKPQIEELENRVLIAEGGKKN